MDRTFQEFANSSDRFVQIVYMQPGNDEGFDALCDENADAQEKAEYLSQWDYGTENEYDDALMNRDGLIELANLPFADTYVVNTLNNTYLLVEQVATGAVLIRAVP